MNQVTESEIVNHEGTTCLLSEPKTADGTIYPFAFDAVYPAEKSWPYRLCGSRDPGSLTNESLTAYLRTGRTLLRAVWEEQVGHRVGFVTIYLPLSVGSGGGATGHRVRYEKGPELNIELPPPSKPSPSPQTLVRRPPLPPSPLVGPKHPRPDFGPSF